MCFSKRVRASDALILSLSSFRDIVQAVFALSASSSYLRLLGQDILASAEDCILTVDRELGLASPIVVLTSGDTFQAVVGGRFEEPSRRLRWQIEPHASHYFWFVLSWLDVLSPRTFAQSTDNPRRV